VLVRKSKVSVNEKKVLKELIGVYVGIKAFFVFLFWFVKAYIIGVVGLVVLFGIFSYVGLLIAGVEVVVFGDWRWFGEDVVINLLLWYPLVAGVCGKIWWRLME